MTRFSWMSECRGKRRYAKKEAKRAARQTETRGCGRLTVYRCEHCGWWHVGHPIGPRVLP